jgi:hypothetical protein
MVTNICAPDDTDEDCRMVTNICAPDDTDEDKNQSKSIITEVSAQCIITVSDITLIHQI